MGVDADDTFAHTIVIVLEVTGSEVMDYVPVNQQDTTDSLTLESEGGT